MTINEIETTLLTLASRHPDLDETMLTTLLLAAGWDDRTRNDALTIFRAGLPTKDNRVALPSVEEEHILPPQIENDHLLVAHSTSSGVEIEKPIVPVPIPEPTQAPIPESIVEIPEAMPLPEPSPEPQSLVTPEFVPPIQKEDSLPENLPVKPFETAPHVWSFSRYKDVFHGSVMPQPKTVKEEAPTAQSVFTPARTTKKRTSVDTKDESLVILAGTCLILIILLLAYMYSNGRL